MEQKVQSSNEIDVIKERNKESTNARKNEKKKLKRKKTVGQEILSWLLTILAALVIAGLIRAFLFENVRVDGSSMINTLQNGEIVIVTKPSILAGNIKRGEIVICRYPGRKLITSIQIGAPIEMNITNHVLFVKRVVGLPGDSIEIKEGKLFLNDELINEPYVDYPPNSDLQKILLGKNQYMVMGDNRAGSHDSRASDVGPISKEMIVGHAAYVIYPFNHIREIK